MFTTIMENGSMETETSTTTDSMLNTPPPKLQNKLSLKNKKKKKDGSNSRVPPRKLTFETGARDSNSSVASGENTPFLSDFQPDFQHLLNEYNEMPPFPIAAGGCAHTIYTIKTNAMVAATLGKFTNVNALLDNSRYIKKDPNDGSSVNSHQMSFKSSLNPAPGAKTPNINIIMNKTLKQAKTVFCNNDVTQNSPFVLKPDTAEQLMGYAHYNLINEIKCEKEYRFPGDYNSYQMRVTDTEFTIAKNYQGIISVFKLCYEDKQQFKADLYATLLVLRTYPNVERMRALMVDYIQTEFGNCKCPHMDSKEALKILLTHYYEIGEGLYDPLPPHHITIGDIINEAFMKI